MKLVKQFIQASFWLIKKKLSLTEQAKLVLCLLGLFSNAVAQNLIPNYSFENVILNENNIGNIPGYTTDWLQIKSPDWFHLNNTDTVDNWSCNGNHYCSSVPKNAVGYQYPKTGLGYSGLATYDKYNANTTSEYLKVNLLDTLTLGKNYCFSINIVLSEYSRYAMSKIGTYFTMNEYMPPPIPAFWYWQFHVTPQALNNGPFIIDTLNWTKIQMSFVADSAYQWITIGSFTDTLTTDSMRVSNLPGWNGAYYYIDDIFLTPLDEPANAAITDTLVATENTVIQLGNNTNTNASYLWWPADNVSDVNSPNPNLLVIQSGWHYVQKTQCSYVTYDSVYVKANPVGISEYGTRSNLFSLVPNPNNGEFVLTNTLNKTTTGTLFIYDNMGKLIEAQVIKDQNSIDVKLKVTNGIYFLRLADASNTSIYLEKILVR